MDPRRPDEVKVDSSFPVTNGPGKLKLACALFEPDEVARFTISFTSGGQPEKAVVEIVLMGFEIDYHANDRSQVVLKGYAELKGDTNVVINDLIHLVTDVSIRYNIRRREGTLSITALYD